MASILGSINDFLTIFFIVILLLVFFYGQNFQGWLAGRQLKNALKKLEKAKNYGIDLIKAAIQPHRSELVNDQDLRQFIIKMLEFFVIEPSNIDPPIFTKIHFLEARKEIRFNELIQQFLPDINELTLSRIAVLFSTTTEINHIFRKVRHNLIVGEKTKSYWYLLQSASEITQTMLTAQAYQTALTSFTKDYPIGDSIGPLVIHRFVRDQMGDNAHECESNQVLGFIYSQEVGYIDRKCVCLRAKGPEIHVGRPGLAVGEVLKNNPNVSQIRLIITIDAISRLEGEIPGTIAQGLGVALGSQKGKNIDKYQIEEMALNHHPPIPLEAIVCRASFEEAVSPMIDPIKNAVPKIVRRLKQIIRTQTQKGDIVLIVGIGNSIGVPL